MTISPSLTVFMTLRQNLSQVTNSQTFCFSVLSVFFIPYFSLAAFIAAIVLMIIVRASYPKNTFGLVLMILYIAVVAISFIAGILLLAACYQMLKECNIPC